MSSIVTLLTNILPPACVLGILIFIHELGHFLVAKISGVRVEQFSIGFGPEIFKFDKGDTVYSIALVPFGGFVKMAGETIEDRKEEELKDDDFLAKSVFKRFAIIFAGPLMNYVLAFVFLVITFMAGSPSLKPIVGELFENYPAYEAGLKSGDKIISIDKNPVYSWPAVQNMIFNSKGDTLNFKVERNNKIFFIEIKPKVVETEDLNGKTVQQRVVGIMPEIVKGNLPQSLSMASQSTVFLTKHIFRSLGLMIRGKVSPKQISGPIGILIISSKVAKKGLIDLMHFTAILSISLAVFNLLPIPALDGGHLFFILIEAIIRKPISFKLQERFAQAGFVLLMMLMVVVLSNDIINNMSIFAKLKNLIPFLE